MSLDPCGCPWLYARVQLAVKTAARIQKLLDPDVSCGFLLLLFMLFCMSYLMSIRLTSSLVISIVREIPAFIHVYKTEVKNGEQVQVGYVKVTMAECTVAECLVLRFVHCDMQPHPKVHRWYKTVRGHGVGSSLIPGMSMHCLVIHVMHFQTELSFTASLLPSLVPPRPWTGWRDGGHLVTPGTVMCALH